METETIDSDEDEPFTLTKFRLKEIKIKPNETTIESIAVKFRRQLIQILK